MPGNLSLIICSIIIRLPIVQSRILLVKNQVKRFDVISVRLIDGHFTMKSLVSVIVCAQVYVHCKSNDRKSSLKELS